jgi:hypothetical protein
MPQLQQLVYTAASLLQEDVQAHHIV